MIDEHLAADRGAMIDFLKGKASISGRFWLVNLLRFRAGSGRDEYQRYLAAAEPAMRAVGAKHVFSSYTTRTVIDGAGAFFDVDGVFIGEYPSAAALIEMNKSEVYQAAHKHRAAALRDTCMYAIPPNWHHSQKSEDGLRRPTKKESTL